MFKVPEYARVVRGPMKSTKEMGNNGAFVIRSCDKGWFLAIIASDGMGWEHVSVHAENGMGKQRTPSWTEMCQVKDLFWDEEDVVVQFHPKKSEYVNCHPNTLHLWRPDETIAGRIPTPPSVMVGIMRMIKR